MTGRQKRLSRFKHYRAPWDRWFHTFYMCGWFAHEVQIGHTVFQWAHKPVDRRYYRPIIGRLLVWRAR